MRKVSKQAAIFLVLLVLYSAWQFPYNSYSPDIARHLEKQAGQAGILLKIDDLKLSFPFSASLTGIGMLIAPRRGIVPLPLMIDSADISPVLSSFLLLNPAVHGDLNLYSGKALLNAAFSPWKRQSSFNISAHGLSIEKYPLAQAIGASGKLATDVSARVNERRGAPAVEAAEIRLSLTEGDYAGGFKIGGLLPLPEAHAVEAELHAALADENFKISACSLISSLGSLNCRGSGELRSDLSPGALRVDADIRLTPDGQKNIGPLLALAAGKGDSEPGRDWNFSIDWKPQGPGPQVKIKEVR